MMGILFAALSAVAAMAAPSPQPASTDANPALWVVRDADTTIYLFGTFHALDGRTNWFNDEVRDAFTRSDQLVLEAVLPKRGSEPPSKPLSRHRDVTASASFLGATRMAISAGRTRGMDVEHGADMVLRRAADAQGKRVEGLESMEFQLDMLGRMSAPRPGPRSSSNRGALTDIGTLMSDMQAAWKHGDQRIFVALLDHMRQTSPDNYRIMFPERNAQWAEWIDKRMETPGTVFVAVGAGHFAGSDSVLSKLTSKGLVATRLNRGAPKA